MFESERTETCQLGEREVTIFWERLRIQSFLHLSEYLWPQWWWVQRYEALWYSWYCLFGDSSRHIGEISWNKHAWETEASQDSHADGGVHEV